MFRFQDGSLRLFRLAHTDVFLHWSWLVLALFGIPRGLMSYSSSVWRIAEYLTLFFIVLLHEFGHVLACRQVGGTADRIVLWPLGGLALVKPPDRPWAFLWTIAAGPMVNLVLVPVTFGLAMLNTFAGLDQVAPDVHLFVLAVAFMNVWILVLNLLPIYPLDGGQILYALLWLLMGRGRSLTVVTLIGLVTGVSVIVLAVASGKWWFVLLAFFVVVSSLSGLYEARGLLRRKPTRHEGLACPSCHTVPPVGAFWLCDNCWKYCDVFAVRAVCPNCAAALAYALCPECNERHPFESWTPIAVPVEDSQSAVLPAEIVDGTVVPVALDGHLNAASYYREALTLMPHLSGTEEKVLTPLGALRTPLDDTTLDLTRRSEPALQQLRQGAARTNCDWEADSPEDLQRLVDLAAPVLQLCGVTCLRARYTFRDNDGHAALDDLAALLVMARHFGRAGPFIVKLVQLTVESVAIDLAGAHLLEQKPHALRAFRARLACLPEAGTLMNAMQDEKRFLLGIERPKFEGKNLEEASILLRRYGKPREARAILKLVGANMSDLLKMFDETAFLYDELGTILMLPPEQFRLVFAEFVRRHRKTNPMVVGSAYDLGNMNYLAVRDRLRLDMLKAAISIACDGNWQEAVRDPSRTGPFKCRCFEAGFELKSRLWFNYKQRIRLVVGKKPGILGRMAGRLKRFMGA